MRNVLLVQLETKVALAIVAIAGIIFLVVLLNGVNNFNKFINQLNIEETNEEIRFQTNP